MIHSLDGGPGGAKPETGAGQWSGGRVQVTGFMAGYLACAVSAHMHAGNRGCPTHRRRCTCSAARSPPRILHHDGGTAGSTCAIYVCPERTQALAVLSNNGVAASLWASGKLSWSNQLKQAYEHFTAT